MRRFITWVIRPSVLAIMAERRTVHAWSPTQAEIKDIVGSINRGLDQAHLKSGGPHGRA